MTALIGNKELNLSNDERVKWIENNKNNLVGSAVFVCGKSKISKLISRVCKGKSKNKLFVPSHVGSLVLVGGNIYKFDMQPPCARIVPLSEWMNKTQDDYIILMRDFKLDTEKFSADVCSRINKRYGYFSAVQSAFKYLWWGLREHCSEVHLKCLQSQGLFTGVNANKTTPVSLYEILTANCDGDKNDINS